jgi:hypothetical protein
LCVIGLAKGGVDQQLGFQVFLAFHVVPPLSGESIAWCFLS